MPWSAKVMTYEGSGLGRKVEAKRTLPHFLHIRVRMPFLGVPITHQFNPMIYFITFILALFLTQIVYARPQTCGNAVSPELLIQGEQQSLPITPQPICDNKYDNLR